MSEISDLIEQYIKEGFPLLKYDTERYVPYRGQTLLFDFVIADLNVYIEVQGKQHYERIPFFHSLAGYRGQKYRDQLKTAWCAENNIILVVFSYKEIEKGLTLLEFRNTILKAVQNYNDGY